MIFIQRHGNKLSYFSNFPVLTVAVNVTLADVLPTETSSTGAVAGAVVAVVGLLLLTGTAVVVGIALVLR